MGFFSFLDLDREYTEFLEQKTRKLQEAAIERELIRQGWRFWSENATDEEKVGMLKSWARGEMELTLYPPGYLDEPVITESKLKVEPELEEQERKWWQLW
jgi:hypothetical protein